MRGRDLVAAEPARPYSRSEYERMAELGFFENERVELLYGRVVAMTPRGVPHDNAIERLTRLLVRGLDDRYSVRVQLSLAASDASMPEPDLAIVDAVDHRPSHPRAAHLVIEVSDTSLQRDREIKSVLYAETGVPEYWVVNLIDKVIEVHRAPENGRYTALQTHRRGDTISALGLEVAVDAIVR